MNLSDRQIENILKLKINQPINPLNFRVLGFQGLADGSNLNRLYNINDIKNNYIRLISMSASIYTTTTWMRENAQDNKTFTTNTNSRYSMLQSAVKLESSYLEQLSSSNKLNIIVDNNSLNIFSNSYEFFQDKIELNILIQSTINEGIDMTYRLALIKDMVTNSATFPNVTIMLYVEIINDINPLQIEQIIGDK